LLVLQGRKVEAMQHYQEALRLMRQNQSIPNGAKSFPD